MKLEVDQSRLRSEIDALAAISDSEAPAVTRIVFTPTDLKARLWLKARCEEAGLTVRQDAIGNTFARWSGSDPEAAEVGTGSHIDAIPNAGKYDGVVGVLGGLEAIRALRKSGFRPKHSIELLVLTSRSPRALGLAAWAAACFPEASLPKPPRRLKDGDGASIDEVRRGAGMRGDLEEVGLPDGYYRAFVELHIEQGPLLERRRIPLGVVTNIAAPASLKISIEGAGGHAGGVLIPDRRDALCAAAELILAVEDAARTTGAIDTVTTVGILTFFRALLTVSPAAYVSASTFATPILNGGMQ